MDRLDSGAPEPALGQLERMDPREVWKHKALDFTPWLEANGDRLAEALGIDIEITASEHPVGSFSLDLIGKDVTHGKPLIVENQLTGSDHTHLGQLLTYAAGTEAATIVWVATSIRDEHRQALTWLNEQTGQGAGCTIIGSFAAGGKLRHELYIDRASHEECKALFDALHDQRDAFEEAYGRPLTWERLDSRKASRIAEYRDGTVENAAQHDEYIAWLLDAGDRMRVAIAAVAVDA